MAELKKKLNLYGLTMIVIGAVIGSGIFKTPSDIAGLLNNHLLIVLGEAIPDKVEIFMPNIVVKCQNLSLNVVKLLYIFYFIFFPFSQ